MLFTDDVLFIHVPKTGGMSITHYLLNNLRGPIRMALPRDAFEHARGMIEHADIAPRLTFVEGKRHEDLREARQVLEKFGMSLERFALILAVTRNPYDLEVSHFFHLQKPHVTARRGGSPEIALAASGDFAAFAANARFFGHNPSRIERFYCIDGEEPSNLEHLRFESMGVVLPRLIAPFSFQRCALQHRNRSDREPAHARYLTAEVEKLIHDKYRYLFRFYERESIRH